MPKILWPKILAKNPPASNRPAKIAAAASNDLQNLPEKHFVLPPRPANSFAQTRAARPKLSYFCLMH
jgi:hypothetical protein